MGKTDKLIVMCIFFKFALPILAVVYLVCWPIEALNPDLFKIIDIFIGFVPSIIDKIIPLTSEIYYTEITNGYVFMALLLVIAAVGFVKYEKKLHSIKKIEYIAEQKKILRAKKQERLKKDQEAQENAQLRNTFFGLLEFKSEYYSEEDKDLDGLLRLTQEFTKIVVKKLKEKYPTIKFDLTDKIFILCNDFSLFAPIIKDISKLYDIFYTTSKQKFIQTNILLSFWAASEDEKSTRVLKILNKINEFKHYNRIILSGGAYFRYIKEKEVCFEFAPLGTSKLLKVLDNNMDLDVNLYSIKRIFK